MDLGEYLPFWNKLSSDERAELGAATVERRFSKGAILHRGADECTGLLIVASGRLRAYTVSEEGRQITLYHLLDHDICLFSAPCIMSSVEFDVMVEVEDDAAVDIISAAVYKRFMEENALVANYTAELMAMRFSDVMWLFDQVMNKRLDARVAALLLEEEQQTESATLAVTHEQLGNHLGSPREVVTRMLKYLQSEGLVELGRGSIRIVDEAGLRALAGNSVR